MLQHVGALERLHEQETERGGALRDGLSGQFPFRKQVSLELADLLGPEFLGRAVEVLGKLPDCADIDLCGLLGVIPGWSSSSTMFRNWVTRPPCDPHFI